MAELAAGLYGEYNPGERSNRRTGKHPGDGECGERRCRGDGDIYERIRERPDVSLLIEKMQVDISKNQLDFLRIP